jgi:hypothetical protein
VGSCEQALRLCREHIAALTGRFRPDDEGATPTIPPTHPPTPEQRHRAFYREAMRERVEAAERAHLEEFEATPLNTWTGDETDDRPMETG